MIKENQKIFNGLFALLNAVLCVLAMVIATRPAGLLLVQTINPPPITTSPS